MKHFLGCATKLTHLQCTRGPVTTNKHEDWRLKQHRVSGSGGEIIGRDVAGGIAGSGYMSPTPDLPWCCPSEQRRKQKKTLSAEGEEVGTNLPMSDIF